MRKKQYLNKKYRIRKKRRFYQKKYFWIGISVFFVFFLLFYLAVFSPFFQIKEIQIEGAKNPSLVQLKDFIKEAVSRKILCFETKSIFLLGIAKTKEKILSQFPQIDEVSLKRKLPHTLRVSFKERQKIALFCTQRECFAIDRKGIIFEKVNQKEKKGLVLRKDIQRSLSLGEKVIKRDDLNLIFKIKTILEELVIQPKEISIFPLRFEVQTTEGWKIFFSKERDLNLQKEELKTLLEKKIQESKKDLEYIDLRFDKIFYKFKD
jgi:cell division protein FtsQ